MRDTAGKVRRTHKQRSPLDPLHTDVQVLDDQQELIYNSSVRTQDVD